MKKPLKIPKFKNKDEERDYWAKIDLTDYFDASDFVPISFPNLKPTSRLVSLRLPEYVIDRAKEKANAINIPYQSLLKRYLGKEVFAD